MTTEQNKLADRLHGAPDAEAFGSIAFAGRAEIIAALRAAGEPVAFVPLSKAERTKGSPVWNETRPAGAPDAWVGYDLMPLYAAQPAPSASVREAAELERKLLDGVVDRQGRQHIMSVFAALSSTPSPLMAAGEAGGQDLMDRAAHILNQATGGPEGWSQWDEAVMNVVREAADRLAALSSQPSRIDAAARASETVEATSPAKRDYAAPWPKEEIEPGRFVDVDPEVLESAASQKALIEQAFKLSCEDQYRLAGFIAANIGYVLAGEPEHPDSPHVVAAEPARDMGASVNPVENESDQVRCGPMGEDDWKDQRIASLEAYIAQLKDQQAMAEPTREEIAAALRKALTENWKDVETLRSWSEDILLTGCRRAGGIGYEKPMEAAQNLALGAAAAILALKPRGEPAREGGK